MSYIRYNLHKSNLFHAPDAIPTVLRAIWEREQPVRLVFFGPADTPDAYEDHLDAIHAIINQWFPIPTTRPLVSYVAQKPLDCAWAMETQNISKEFADILTFKEIDGTRYATIEGERGEKMLMTQGIQARDITAAIAEQSTEIFETLRAILEAEKMVVKSIDRQWNYIEKITHCANGTQNYQEFNDARTEFYADTNWSSGYPAATGIGTSAGGVMVEVDAATLTNTRTVALDNLLQVAAHAYTPEVLLGEQSQKTTPKFERARAIVYQSIFGDREALIYISGTAAIRGQESLINVGIEEQTKATLENIEYLIGNENLKKHHVDLPKLPQIQIFRVYLKFEKDLDPACAIITALYPTIPCLYVLSDVCRDELLIEIEGTAE